MQVSLESLDHLVHGRLVLLEAAGEILRHDHSASALHDFRRSARKLYGTLALVEWALPPQTYTRAIALPAEVPRGLGGLRDADVALKSVREFAAEAGVRAEPLVRALERRTARGRERRIERAVERTKRRSLRAPLLKALASSPRTRDGDPLALPSARLALRSKRATAPGAADVDLHAFRRELKAFRDGCEALGERAFELRPVVAEAEQAGELLGAWTDALALEALASSLMREDGVGRSATTVIDHAVALRRDARESFLRQWHGGDWPHLRAIA